VLFVARLVMMSTTSSSAATAALALLTTLAAGLTLLLLPLLLLLLEILPVVAVLDHAAALLALALLAALVGLLGVAAFVTRGGLALLVGGACLGCGLVVGTGAFAGVCRFVMLRALVLGGRFRGGSGLLLRGARGFLAMTRTEDALLRKFDRSFLTAGRSLLADGLRAGHGGLLTRGGGTGLGNREQLAGFGGGTLDGLTVLLLCLGLLAGADALHARGGAGRLLGATGLGLRLFGTGLVTIGFGRKGHG